MDLLIQQKPQIFDLNDEYAPGTRAYKVLDHEAYMEGIVANLRAPGLCSERDPDDVLARDHPGQGAQPTSPRTSTCCSRPVTCAAATGCTGRPAAPRPSRSSARPTRRRSAAAAAGRILRRSRASTARST